MMNFSDALNSMKAGNALRRVGWNGKGLKIKIQFPDAHSKMTVPYIYIEYPPDTDGFVIRCPWLASQTDLLSSDWEIAK